MPEFRCARGLDLKWIRDATAEQRVMLVNESDGPPALAGVGKPVGQVAMIGTPSAEWWEWSATCAHSSLEREAPPIYMHMPQWNVIHWSSS